MNRKGKKRPPTAVRKAKASRPKTTSANNRGLSKLKNKGVSAKKKPARSNNRQSLVNKISQGNSAKKRNITAKANILSKTKPANLKVAKPKPSLLWLAVYALTIAVGLSTLLGTTIAVANSFKTPVPQQQTASNNSNKKKANTQNKTKLQQILTLSSLGQEISPLKNKLEELAQQYPQLKPEVFLVDLDTKGFVSIQGQEKIASASTIKLPILVAFFQDLDRGQIRLDEQLVMTKDSIAGGSGDMQHEQPGTRFSALETASKMIVISDNTATNMLIDRLGGKEKLNQRFKKMGLTNTQLNNPLPDLTGTNTTSPEDLGSLLMKINSGELISMRSRDRLLHIMGNVERDTLLPQGLESGALIAHKTGDIKSVLADVGTIDMPNGKRYIASMLIKRPDNSPEAQEFIQKASGIAYQYFKNPQTQAFTIEENGE